MATETPKQPIPAYISYNFWINFINGLRESGVPMQIDRTLMPKASGSQVSTTLSSLKFLKLIDQNSKPTIAMKQLVQAKDEDRTPILKGIVETAYPFLFEDPEFHLEEATGQLMADKFRALGVSGATLSKSIVFFLAAAKAADIKVSSHIKPPPVVASKRVVNVRNKKVYPDESVDEEEEQDEDLDGETQKFQIPIPGKPSAIFIIPKDLSQDEWNMLKTMLDAYIALLQKQNA
jgi:Family of unknown function (DUF5343)